ncbi:hypothetical protein F4825DRAFT_441514 [Nemania diffusa]|nr:hypothetical protein F4825DRAFT_441514 [Nemania diffusa]
MAPLCRFYQQGNCRNGASCRFEHPGANTNANPFGAPGTKPQDGTNAYRVTKDSIKVDLAEERPGWILSCYGPGKDAPEQLFGGYPREQSLEEVMVYIKGSANQQQAMSEVQALHSQAEQQIRTILGNLDGAVDFVLAAENNQPNRIDICKQNTLPGGTTGVFSIKTGQEDNNTSTNNVGTNQNPFSTATQPNAFGGGGGTGGPAFGQPSALGHKPNPFGATPAAPQFGQPSQMGAAAPAFGQPSQMGAAAPAFGQPSQMGASAPAFGQPSQMGASAPAFGQPSTIGQRPNPFATASSTAPSPFSQVGQSTFGQPSTLGRPANPFGAPATAPTNPFNQPSSAASGASPFANVSSASNASPFGQPAPSNPFAQPASKDVSMDTSTPGPAPNNPFGQPPSTNTGFGTQGGGMGTGFPPATSNAFGGGGAQPQNSAHPLRNVMNQTPSATAGVKPGPYAPNSTKQHPPIESYTRKAPNGQLIGFRNQQVIYKWKVGDRYQDQPPENPTADQQTPGFRKPDGSWRKILFPAGPPPYNPDTEPDPAEYTDAIKAAYTQIATTGRFQGDMPEVPPMREDCVWLF